MRRASRVCNGEVAGGCKKCGEGYVAKAHCSRGGLPGIPSPEACLSVAPPETMHNWNRQPTAKASYAVLGWHDDGVPPSFGGTIDGIKTILYAAPIMFHSLTPSFYLTVDYMESSQKR